MSVQVATSTALGTGGLRQRSLTRAASRVVKPLAKFVNIPGIQDFAHTAQELAVTLKPWALQAPGVNDMAAKSILLHVEEISAMIAQQMEKMDMDESAIIDTEAQLSRLGEFTRYLQDTKAELETYQQQSYSTKIAFQTEMATMLVERESELRHRVLVFCLENALHMGCKSVRTRGTAEHIKAQIVMLQAQDMVMARSQREAATSIADMKAQIAGVTKVIDRMGCPEFQILLFITTIHRSIFFLIFDFSA